VSLPDSRTKQLAINLLLVETTGDKDVKSEDIYHLRLFHIIVSFLHREKTSTKGFGQKTIQGGTHSHTSNTSSYSAGGTPLQQAMLSITIDECRNKTKFKDHTLATVGYTKPVTPDQKKCNAMPMSKGDGHHLLVYTATSSPCAGCKEKPFLHDPKCFQGKCTKCNLYGHGKILCCQKC
jgi:hypothetical protein